MKIEIEFLVKGPVFLLKCRYIIHYSGRNITSKIEIKRVDANSLYHALIKMKVDTLNYLNELGKLILIGRDY